MKKYLKIAQPYLLLCITIFCFGFTPEFTNGVNNKLVASELDESSLYGHIYVVNLSGDNEVPSVDTEARGKAIVRINRDGSAVHYKLIVHNIDNVVAAHFHMAPAGSNGGVVAHLFGGGPTGMVNGMLAQGTITDDNADLDMLIEGIRSGNIYINIHSTDVPSGELRGQL